MSNHSFTTLPKIGKTVLKPLSPEPGPGSIDK
jgi:hypothetical protein